MGPVALSHWLAGTRPEGLPPPAGPVGGRRAPRGGTVGAVPTGWRLCVDQAAQAPTARAWAEHVDVRQTRRLSWRDGAGPAPSLPTGRQGAAHGGVRRRKACPSRRWLRPGERVPGRSRARESHGCAWKCTDEGSGSGPPAFGGSGAWVWKHCQRPAPGLPLRGLLSGGRVRCVPCGRHLVGDVRRVWLCCVTLGAGQRSAVQGHHPASTATLLCETADARVPVVQ